MADFKVGSTKVVAFDPVISQSVFSNVWRPHELSAYKVVDTRIEDNQSMNLGEDARPVGWGYVAEGAASLRIRANGDMSIGGLTAISSVDLGGLAATRYNFLLNASRPFMRAQTLSQDTMRALSNLHGYPVQIRASAWQHGDFDSIGFLSDGNGNNITSPQGINEVHGVTTPLRGQVTIRCWLGASVDFGREIGLVNVDGSALRWPESLRIFPGSGAVDRLSAQALENVPMWAEIEPTGWPALGYSGSYGLFADPAVAMDVSSTINGVDTIYGVTNPGAIDTDGTVQPLPFPGGIQQGLLQLSAPLPSARRPERTASFRARVVSSEIVPEVRAPDTGALVQRSQHVVILEASDRVAAGLAATPFVLASTAGAQYAIDGGEYYLTEVIETEGSAVILAMSTQSQG